MPTSRARRTCSPRSRSPARPRSTAPSMRFRPTSRPFVESIESMRTFEAAIEHLVEGIERAELRSGARLPTERELAAQLGISIPTLRQALTVLARSGLLGSRQGKGGGWFVTSELV